MPRDEKPDTDRPTPPKTAVDAVRAKLAELGITERDVAAAIAWARSSAARSTC